MQTYGAKGQVRYMQLISLASLKLCDQAASLQMTESNDVGHFFNYLGQLSPQCNA